MEKLVLLISIIIFIFNGSFIAGICDNGEITIGVAVEFMDHAAAAYIAQHHGWFEEEGLDISSYESYVTGIALASALGRGDIQVAYICLVPAINAYANAKVPVKIVAGTHKYGYGLVIDGNKVKNIQDIEKKGIKIGCVTEGGTVDVLLHKTIEKYNLNKNKVLNNIQRMNPPKQLLAIQMGKLDAAFLPEQWATMAENYKFNMLLMCQDIWPEMQGSVLIVKTELIEEYPDIVKKLIKVTEKATKWINKHPKESADILARQLSLIGEDVLSIESKIKKEDMDIIKFNQATIFKSMSRLDYRTDIDEESIQDIINYLEKIGYIKENFNVNHILDLRFLEQ